jgi:hypothetical protein
MDTMFNDEWELEGIHSIVDGKPFVIPEDAIGYVSRVVSSFERRR